MSGALLADSYFAMRFKEDSDQIKYTQIENFDILNKNHKLPHKLFTSCFSEKVDAYKLTHKLNTSCPGMENCKKLNTSYSRLANCSKRGYRGGKGGPGQSHCRKHRVCDVTR